MVVQNKAMHLIILSTLLAGTLAAPMIQSLNVNDDGTYQFFYETGKEAGYHKRSEAKQPDGVVIGKFSYEDPNGELREVNYRADDSGYTANGDVSVDGAPKGQFPAVPEETNEAPLPSGPQGEIPEPQSFAVEETKPDETAAQPDSSSAEENPESLTEEESKHEDLKELPSEENTADEPPEAFPPGFFLEKFHGLRRFPEPTKEAESTSKEPISEKPKESPSTEAPKPTDQPAEQPEQVVPNAHEDPYVNLKAAHEMELFMHLRPFQSFSPQQMDTSMFRQPVYVFSYQHPDSYGYRYFF
ncbi:unnamed protein product [Larinioides sclopetarius]|uniref:Cuticle protein n=1 Tax=Larinioides sclopetarius TaxID=280406 RepID=A0AAV2BAT3_9ARAC